MSTNSKEGKIVGPTVLLIPKEMVLVCFIYHNILGDWSPNQFDGMIRWWSQYHVCYAVWLASNLLKFLFLSFANKHNLCTY